MASKKNDDQQIDQNVPAAPDDAGRAAGKKSARLEIESLEPRILLSATWVGTDTDDAFDGTNDADHAHGMDGNDVMHGGAMDDVLHGGAGDDVLYGDDHNDVLDGGTGDDHLFGGDHNDVLISGGGNDYLDGGKHDDVFRFDGAQDGDVITVEGGHGHDTIDLSNYSPDQIHDDGSTLTVDMGEGQSFTVNYTGIEEVISSAPATPAPPPESGPGVGGGMSLSGDDYMEGDDGDNVLDGGAGDDSIHGGAGHDTLIGGVGDDTLVGGEGHDTLMGGHGDDTLVGGEGHDTADYSDADASITIDITSAHAQDTGGAGIDTLSGMEGVVGGDHDDTFGFSEPEPGANYTVDGGGGHNTIDLSHYDHDDVTFEHGTMTVDMGDGHSFTIDHANVDAVQFGDTTVHFRVWDGDADNGDFSDPANWSDDTLPGHDDIVIFNGTSGDNAVLDADFGGAIGGIQITDDYSGHLTLGAGLTVDGDVVIDAGGFDAGHFDLQINGDVIVHGGTFDAGTGVTAIGGDLDVTGGAFDHSNGTVLFNGDGDQFVSADGDGLTFDDLTIDKPDGTLTFGDDVLVRGDFTVEAGHVDASNVDVEFQGYNTTIAGGDAVFGDVTFNTSGNTTIDGTLDVNGDLTIQNLSNLNGGEVRVSGNVTTTDTSYGGSGTVVMDGAGDQTISADGGTGELHNLSVDKADGTLTLTDNIEISGDFSHVNGTVDATGANVEFQGYNTTIAGGDATFGNVTFDASGNTTIDGVLDVNGDLTIQNLSNLNGGEVRVSGNVTTTDTSYGGDGTVVMDGAGDQTISADGGTGELHNLSVDKADGTLTLADHIQISGDFTIANGSVDASNATVEFQGYNTTIAGGDATFGNVTFDASGNTTIDGVLDVNGDLTIQNLSNLNGGEVRVSGNVTTTDTSYGGDGTVVMDGAGDQTISADGGTGELHNLSVDKSDGTLTLADHIQISGDFTIANGSVDASNATVEFQGYNTTIAATGMALSNVTFNTSGNTTIDGTLDVDGDLTIQNLSNLNGGEVRVSGNVTTTDTSYGGSGTVVMDGAGDQTISANGDTGELHHLTVDKADGTLTLADHIQISGDFTIANGSVDASNATVEFQGYNTTIAATGMALGNVTFNTSGNTTIDGTLGVDGDLTIQNLSNLNGGEVRVSGNVTTTDTSYGGDGTVVMDGAGDQTISADGGTGELHNLSVDKADGTLTLTDNIEISGDLTLVNGDVDASQANVEFQGYNTTIAATGMALSNVTFNTSGNTTIDGTLDVDGDLTIENLSNLNGGEVRVSGNVTTTDTSYGGSGTVVMDGAGDQTISANGDIGELHHLTVDKADGTLTLADHIQISGDLTLVNGSVDASNATVEFQGYNTSIHADGMVFSDLALNTSGTTTFDGDMIVTGQLTITNLSTLNGGTIYVGGSINEIDASHGGTAMMVLGYPDGSPSAEAGPDLTVIEGETVTLTGSGVDPDGDTVTYEWVQTDGPTVTLDDPTSATPTFTAPDISENTDVTFELRVSDGEHVSVDTVAITVSAEVETDELFAFAGDDQIVSEGDTVTLAATGWHSSDYTSFDDVAFESYGGAEQDVNVALDVEDGGLTLHMTGNGWKAMDFPVTITADTILEFDFRSTSEGEIHGIGFDTDGDLSPDQTFKLYGSQDWGIDATDNYDGGDGEWQHYEIRVGDYFTGDYDKLVFVNDQDTSNPDAESMFRNVRVHEGDAEPAGDLSYTWTQTGGPEVTLSDANGDHPTFESPDVDEPTTLTFEVQVNDGGQISTDVVEITVNPIEPPALHIDAGPDIDAAEGDTVTLAGSATVGAAEVSFTTDSLESYGGPTQDVNVAIGIEDAGQTLQMTGNGWKSMDFPYTVTEDTILEFDFRSGAEGEIHGIGFDTDGDLSPDQTFKLYGSQDWGIDAHDDYGDDVGDGEWQHYQIRVGDYFTGDFDKLVFVNDHDAGGDGAESMFSNLRVYEDGADAAPADDVSYTWTQTGGPEVTLDDAHGATPTFTAPEGLHDAELTFELTVTRGDEVQTDTVTVNVHADNDAAIADAGDDLFVNEGDPVTLSGSGVDPEGQDLTYEWVQTSGPTVTLDDATSATPTFTAPDVPGDTTIEFELHVSDGVNTSVDTVSVSVAATDASHPADPPGMDDGGTIGDNHPTDESPDVDAPADNPTDNAPVIEPTADTPVNDPPVDPTVAGPDGPDNVDPQIGGDGSDGSDVVADGGETVSGPTAGDATGPKTDALQSDEPFSGDDLEEAIRNMDVLDPTAGLAGVEAMTAADYGIDAPGASDTPMTPMATEADVHAPAGGSFDVDLSADSFFQPVDDLGAAPGARFEDVFTVTNPVSDAHADVVEPDTYAWADRADDVDVSTGRDHGVALPPTTVREPVEAGVAMGATATAVEEATVAGTEKSPSFLASLWGLLRSKAGLREPAESTTNREGSSRRGS